MFPTHRGYSHACEVPAGPLFPLPLGVIFRGKQGRGQAVSSRPRPCIRAQFPDREPGARSTPRIHPSPVTLHPIAPRRVLSPATPALRPARCHRDGPCPVPAMRSFLKPSCLRSRERSAPATAFKHALSFQGFSKRKLRTFVLVSGASACERIRATLTYSFQASPVALPGVGGR